VRAVIFDAGHTLLEADYACLTGLVRSRGYDVSEGQVTTAERRARARLDAEQAAQPSRAKTGAGRYLRYLMENLGVTTDADVAAVAAWRRRFNLPVGLCHLADAEAAAALRRLKEIGLITGVISNSNGSARQALEAAGLARHLDFVIDSTVVGVRKPDPRIFKLGLEAAGVEPAEAVYIGDSYFVDVCGARAIGMGAVLFDPGGVWGRQDCPSVTGLRTAAALAVGMPGRGGARLNGAG
jgi:HAD superfamily hydrolase (TIGR01509 family)